MVESQLKLQKTKYFQGRSLSHIAQMRLAKEAGLFPKKEGWRNVVEHMVVEAEAADVLGEAFGLPVSDRRKLYVAALLHDVYKRRERAIVEQKGASGFDESAAQQSEWLRRLGYPQDIIEFTESVGHTSLVKFQNLDQVPLALKIIHYIDSITHNNDLVPLDQRMDALEDNPQYAEINRQVIAVFGRPYLTVQRENSKRIEKEFAEKIALQDPNTLPIWIRNRIFSRIEASGS